MFLKKLWLKIWDSQFLIIFISLVIILIATKLLSALGPNLEIIQKNSHVIPPGGSAGTVTQLFFPRMAVIT